MRSLRGQGQAEGPDGGLVFETGVLLTRKVREEMNAGRSGDVCVCFVHVKTWPHSADGNLGSWRAHHCHPTCSVPSPGPSSEALAQTTAAVNTSGHPLWVHF